MKSKWKVAIALIVLVSVSLFSSIHVTDAKEKKEETVKIPSHVLEISKENTFPNSTEDQEVVEPSDLTKKLIEEIEIPIENPDLIKMMNETSLKPSPIAIGYRGMVYMGRWPLN